METRMGYIRSVDGTRIAFERTGSGPPIVLVDGSFSHLASGPARKLASLLAEDFTVVGYDRRGRGDSGDTEPYLADREVDDLAAVIAAVGEPAGLFGYSAGAALALRGVAAGLPIDRAALWEPPIVDPGARRSGLEAQAAVATALAAGRRDDAVRQFLLLAAGAPRPVVGTAAVDTPMGKTDGRRTHTALRLRRGERRRYRLTDRRCAAGRSEHPDPAARR